MPKWISFWMQSYPCFPILQWISLVLNHVIVLQFFCLFYIILCFFLIWITQVWIFQSERKSSRTTNSCFKQIVIGPGDLHSGSSSLSEVSFKYEVISNHACANHTSTGWNFCTCPILHLATFLNLSCASTQIQTISTSSSACNMFLVSLTLTHKLLGTLNICRKEKLHWISNFCSKNKPLWTSSIPSHDKSHLADEI